MFFLILIIFVVVILDDCSYCVGKGEGLFVSKMKHYCFFKAEEQLSKLSFSIYEFEIINFAYDCLVTSLTIVLSYFVLDLTGI